MDSPFLRTDDSLIDCSTVHSTFHSKEKWRVLHSCDSHSTVYSTAILVTNSTLHSTGGTLVLIQAAPSRASHGTDSPLSILEVIILLIEEREDFFMSTVCSIANSMLVYMNDERP